MSLGEGQRWGQSVSGAQRAQEATQSSRGSDMASEGSLGGYGEGPQHVATGAHRSPKGWPGGEG